MKVYPIFLNNLKGRRCVIFGGNHEAERKAAGLMECDADVVVYSEKITETMQSWVDESTLEWVPRWYKPGDLKGAFLAIVAITDHEATRPIWAEAERENVLLNAMDDVPHCSFVAGSVVQRGPLTISISTSGSAPALSVRLREKLEEQFGPEYGDFLDALKALRPAMMSTFPEFAERKNKWYEIVDSDVIKHFEAGRPDDACRQIKDILDADEGICIGQNEDCFCEPSAKN